METAGLLEPATEAAARERFVALGPAANEVVGAVVRALAREDEAVEGRVGDDVRETGHEALFASLLLVRIGTREELKTWVAERDRSLTLAGSENVDNAVWHDAPFRETVVAATYQNERQAAVDTLRRQAFGRLYREVVRP